MNLFVSSVANRKRNRPNTCSLCILNAPVDSLKPPRVTQSCRVCCGSKRQPRKIPSICKLSQSLHCPEPVKLTSCGLPLALSAMLTAANRVPLTEGVKVTLIVQVPPAATAAPHVLL